MTIKHQGGIFGRNPSFNTVEVENGITSTGPVTLSGPSGQTLTLKTTDLGGVGGDLIGGVLFYGSDASDPGEGVKSSVRALVRGGAGDGSELVFTTSDGSTNDIDRLLISKEGDVSVLDGNLVIGTSGNGIDFSATSGTGTSELLSDYEEGLWTPTVDSGTCVKVYGSYIKVGKMVHATFKIQDLSDTTTASPINVSLPFTAGSSGSSEWLGSWLIRRYDVSTSVAGVMRVQGSGTTMHFRYSDSTVGSEPKSVNYDDLTSGTNEYLAGSITYFAAS